MARDAYEVRTLANLRMAEGRTDGTHELYQTRV